MEKFLLEKDATEKDIANIDILNRFYRDKKEPYTFKEGDVIYSEHSYGYSLKELKLIAEHYKCKITKDITKANVIVLPGYIASNYYAIIGKNLGYEDKTTNEVLPNIPIAGFVGAVGLVGAVLPPSEAVHFPVVLFNDPGTPPLFAFTITSLFGSGGRLPLPPPSLSPVSVAGF